MRRIIQNSTAIAACLALLAPHAVLAQAEMPQDDAAAQEAAATAEQVTPPEADPCSDPAAEGCDPALADVAGDEMPEPPMTEAGTDAAPADDATSSDTTEPGDAEAGAAEVVPAPESPADDAATTAQPEAAQPEAVEAEAPAKEQGQVETDLSADAAVKTGSDSAAVPVDPENEAAQLPDESAAPVPETSAETEPATEPDQQPAEVDQDMAETGMTAEDPTAEDQTETAIEAQADQPAPDAAATQAEADSSAAGNMPADAEPADGAGQAEMDAEAQADSQQPPEQGVPETEAALEAAQGTQAPSAAALDEEAGGEVVEEQVTEENSRSSSEDFATDLGKALKAATQPAEPSAQASDSTAQAGKDAGKDDDGKDLARALLLGLGGIAVGAMLNNNRQVELSTPDRVVVTRADGSRQVIKDEVALLRQPGSTVTTENFDDGSSRTIVTRPDGSKVVTIRDADLRVLRRTLVSPDGQSVRLIDDTQAQPVDIAQLPAPAQPYTAATSELSEEALRDALLRETRVGRGFTLAQIRDIPQVSSLVAPIDIDMVTFDTGSAAIDPDQARKLASLAKVIREAIARNPREIFLIEGHTDTVGSDAANLALSDRRAESVALALTEYFDVPPENLVVQGYGEQFLKVRREGDIRANRRAAVRRITDLLDPAAN